MVEVIERQQPLTRYPFRNPLPFPAEDFVVRRGELAAWVAVVEEDGAPRVAGHVAVLAVADTPIGRLWSAAAGRPVSELGAVSVLVVDHELTGRGLGGALLSAAEEFLADRGLTPVLEVLDAHDRAAWIYRDRGWEQVGTARPEWLPEAEDPVQLMILRS